MKILLNKKAFTLLEVLIATTILMVLAAITSVSYKAGSSAWEKAEARVEIIEKGRMALDLIASEIRMANLPPSSTNYEFVRGDNPLNPTGLQGHLADLSAEALPVYFFLGLPGPRFHGNTALRAQGLVQRRIWNWMDPGGNGIDDDLDGRVDEEIPDGYDVDYDFAGNPGIADGRIDEDIRYVFDALYFFAGDDMHFVGFGVDPFPGKSSSGVLYRIHIDKDDNGISYYNQTAQMRYKDIMDSFLLFLASPNQYTRILPTARICTGFQRLAIATEVVGLNFIYHFFDYPSGMWKEVDFWDSTDEGAADKSWRFPVYNEEEDISFWNEATYTSTDGLPSVVEIRLFLQDEKRNETPQMLSAKVFISQH